MAWGALMALVTQPSRAIMDFELVRWLAAAGPCGQPVSPRD